MVTLKGGPPFDVPPVGGRPHNDPEGGHRQLRTVLGMPKAKQLLFFVIIFSDLVAATPDAMVATFSNCLLSVSTR